MNCKEIESIVSKIKRSDSSIKRNYLDVIIEFDTVGVIQKIGLN